MPRTGHYSGASPPPVTVEIDRPGTRGSGPVRFLLDVGHVEGGGLGLLPSDGRDLPPAPLFPVATVAAGVGLAGVGRMLYFNTNVGATL